MRLVAHRVAHEPEMVDENLARPRELADHLNGRWGVFDRPLLALEARLDLGWDHRDVAEALEEIDMPGVAAKFAVGDRGEAGVFLKPDRLADRLVLGRAQLLGRDVAAGFRG